MNETTVSVVGNVATAPVYRETATGPVTRFRIAATSRYHDPAKDAWVDGHTNFYTVWARRALGVNAAASLGLGEPVVVQGRLKVRSEDRGGQHWSSVDIEATAIGHDLARGTAAFRRARPEYAGGQQAQQPQQAQQAMATWQGANGQAPALVGPQPGSPPGRSGPGLPEPDFTVAPPTQQQPQQQQQQQQHQQSQEQQQEVVMG
ncbi:single-stranded DNA-binding protein [Streptomyces physcomitrii]|uniref:Single-stranded DNA-binding protein n=1 Tax=Streptomyces physcomitrii TaxID=2724184 RepID=A0ABX1H2M2_9ACTN|nr:single-stranded DNA-binding protein [Streptomyces physcomitrii]NKI42591.1 single-stranded DNA-binding protein [Streptomyces physcomitrii]